MNQKNNKSNYNNYNSKSNKSQGNRDFQKTKPNVSPAPQYSPNHLSDISSDRTAKAPYNFIPLNEKVVPSELSVNDIDLSVYNGNTGYIDLNFKTITPLYIRDTYNESEMIEDSLKSKKNEKFINPNFFSPGGLPKIPGSSQRGMIKTLMEIITYSKFGFIDDKTLYFRDFAKKPLNNIYRDYDLVTRTTVKGEKDEKDRLSINYNVGCGILKKEGRKYIIKDYGNPKRIKKEYTQKEADAVAFQLNPKRWQFFETSDKSKKIIISGQIPTNNPEQMKKRDWYIELKNYKGDLEFTKQDIKDYKNDVTRPSDNPMVPDLIKLANEKENGVPIFFYKWTDFNGKVKISIGHTGMLRLPYKLSIGEHIPKELKDKTITDFVEAMFGDKEKCAGRLYFEDAVCKNNSNVYMEEASPKILSNPKPTTFQHYLVQNSKDMIHLYHYNSVKNNNKVPIRGNKLYWHKDTDWKATTAEINSHSTQYTKIKAVKPRISFYGRIRFENLTNAEVGALLFALDLPDNCCYKLGMGKPLGLGTINLTPKLFLSNRENRYSDLSSEWTTSKETKIEEFKQFKQYFATYILNSLNNDKKEYSVDDLWKTERLKELKTMLDYSLKPNTNDIQYMTIQKNEFKDREVLPKPSKVKK